MRQSRSLPPCCSWDLAWRDWVSGGGGTRNEHAETSRETHKKGLPTRGSAGLLLSPSSFLCQGFAKAPPVRKLDTWPSSTSRLALSCRKDFLFTSSLTYEGLAHVILGFSSSSTMSVHFTVDSKRL